MKTSNRLEMFLTLNAEAFKKGLSAAGAGVRNMAGGADAAFTGTKARLQENLVAVKKYNAGLQQQSGIVQGLKGHVTALVGAYLGFQSITGVIDLLRSADSAAFSLEASLRAANREFTNIGNADSWTAAIGRMAEELRIYSKSELKTAVASTIDMTKRLGFSAEQMEVLIKRTADLSAGKTDLKGGIERVTAAMRGEAEASEYLGLTLNENYVIAWHEVHNAHNKAWKDLTDLEKAQVRFNVFLEQATPLTGKAADSVKTLSGAYALAKANIHDAVEENKNAVDATKQLATLMAENADQIGEIATILITAATATMQFVLNNKEAVAAVGLVALGVGALSFAISSLTTVWQALNVVMLATTGLQFAPWAATVVAALTSVNLAALTLKTSLGALAALVLAFEVGQKIGEWLNGMAPVQKWMTGLIYTADRAQLAVQKLWAQLTGGDVAAVEQKIEVAKQAFNERLAEIDKEGADQNKPPEKASADPDKMTGPATPEEPAKKDVGYRTTDYLDMLDEAVLSPDELEDRKKRWAERDAQEQKLTAEKNDQLDKIAADKTAEDEKRAAIRTADAKRKLDPKSDYYDPKFAAQQAQQQPKKSGSGGGGGRRPAAEPEEDLPNKDAAAEAARQKQEAKEEEAAQRREERDRDREASNAQALEQIQTLEQQAVAAFEEGEQQRQAAQEKTLEEAKQAAADRASAETAATDQAKSAFQKYADKVRALQDDIAGRERSVAEELGALDKRGTVESKWRRQAKEAAEYEKAAKAAMQAGDLNKALSLSDQAKAAYSGLQGGAGNISDKLGDRAAFSGVKSAGELGIAISKALQAATAKTALSSMPGADLFGNLTANIRGQLAAVAGGGSDKTAGQGAAPAAKVHELRFAGGSMRGSEADVEALFKLLEQSGMTAG